MGDVDMLPVILEALALRIANVNQNSAGANNPTTGITGQALTGTKNRATGNTGRVSTSGGKAEAIPPVQDNAQPLPSYAKGYSSSSSDPVASKHKAPRTSVTASKVSHEGKYLAASAAAAAVAATLGGIGLYTSKRRKRTKKQLRR